MRMRMQRLLEFLRPRRAGRVRVLVATCPNVRDAIAPILSDCPVEFACDMAAGLRALGAGAYTHVVVGYLFAESQMFEFARHVREAQPEARVVCVKAVGRKLSPGTRHGLNAAALSIGCEGFFDLSAGDLPEAMFRHTFEELVARFGPRGRKPREEEVVEALRTPVHDLHEAA